MSWEVSHVMGETKVRNHCTFVWREPIDPADGVRHYEIGDMHCEGCVRELASRGVRIDDRRHGDAHAALIMNGAGDDDDNNRGPA
jgi:hypothetical protein